jgi:hypothetical protein
VFEEPAFELGVLLPKNRHFPAPSLTRLMLDHERPFSRISSRSESPDIYRLYVTVAKSGQFGSGHLPKAPVSLMLCRVIRCGSR